MRRYERSQFDFATIGVLTPDFFNYSTVGNTFRRQIRRNIRKTLNFLVEPKTLLVISIAWWTCYFSVLDTSTLPQLTKTALYLITNIA